MIGREKLAYEALKRAQEKVHATPYRPYPDKPENHVWNQRTYKQFMKDCIESGETEEERDLIKEAWYIAFVVNSPMFRGLQGW